MNDQSFLITGGNPERRLGQARKIAPAAILVSPTGIEEIRELEKIIATGQAVIINNAQNLSEEAQNAFLKTLEEAQANIVLLAENEDQLLPTIVSRCFLISLSNLRNLSIFSDLNELKKIINWVETGNFSEGSKWAETVKDRGEAIGLIDNLIQVSGAKYLRQFLKAKRYLKANTNVRLTLENLFLK